jgi:TRAP-type mannitol/chloroaromatic compound transport system permease small subunit
MQKLLLAVDRLSTWLGQLFAWFIVVLTFLITYEVFSRYVLNNPHDWNLNVQIMLYGTLFMMAGAYTLSKNGHVRGDVLYGFFRAAHAGHHRPDPVRRSSSCRASSRSPTPAGPTPTRRWRSASRPSPPTPLPLYPFKFVIPVAGGMLLLQGIVEIVRCIICLRDGEWPSRELDVEEVDVDKLKEMVHVKDEDIEALDKYVVGQAGGGK